MSDASAVPALSADLHTFAEASLAKWHVPGAAIGILKDGEMRFAAFGRSRLDVPYPTTHDTLFRVASITKPFTATLAMTLVNDGLLDLDRPIAEYLPGIALSDADDDWQDAITMRHLLSHTAGIDCELPVNLAVLGNGDEALADAVGFYGGLHQWAKPGQIMSYGNTGFWLAGHVIATILGTTFEEAMRARVFRPLGLQRTVFTAAEAIVFPTALGHEPRSHEDPTHELIRSYAYPRARTPSGGVISTVEDLLTFAAWHLGERPELPISLSAALREAMREPQVRLRGADSETWGIGWDLAATSDGTTLIGHGGSYGGFQTQLTLVPERGFAFAILTNSARGGMANAEIEQWVLQHELGLAADDPTPVTLPAAELARFAGTYRQPLATYDIAATADGLAVTVRSRGLAGEDEPAAPVIRMSPIGERDFYVTRGGSKGTRADFVPDPETGELNRVRIGLRIAERVDG